ncbi:hypothetical protein [Microcella sp.]|uniref:hypothetical protein n=1 Tax=Microcella sp. TaxID=1913979 RepID=UPI00391B6613
MEWVILIIGGLVAITIGLCLFAVPTESSKSFKRAASTVRISPSFFAPGSIRFTGVAFVVGGVIFTAVALMQLTN